MHIADIEWHRLRAHLSGAEGVPDLLAEFQRTKSVADYDRLNDLICGDGCLVPSEAAVAALPFIVETIAASPDISSEVLASAAWLGALITAYHWKGDEIEQQARVWRSAETMASFARLRLKRELRNSDRDYLRAAIAFGERKPEIALDIIDAA